MFECLKIKSNSFLQMIKKFLWRIIERKSLLQTSFFSETNSIEVKQLSNLAYSS